MNVVPIMNASKRASIPYRSALKYIEEIENELNRRIVSTQRGGKVGVEKANLRATGKLSLKNTGKWKYTKNACDVNEIEAISRNRL